MKKIYICTVSLSVFIAALIVVTKYVTASNEIFFENPPVKITAPKSENSKPGHDHPEFAYAIVIMPKSYRSLLKQFSNHPLARKIQIVPADMEWREGTMVVQPKVRRTNSIPDVSEKSDPAPKKIRKSQPQLASGKNEAIETAMMALFLASASQKRLAK